MELDRSLGALCGNSSHHTVRAWTVVDEEPEGREETNLHTVSVLLFSVNLQCRKINVSCMTDEECQIRLEVTGELRGCG